MHSRLKKVFIVDDSEIIRLRIIRLLHAFEDVEVVGEAANAEDARFMLPKCNPDFLILDIELPGLNGIGLLEHVKDDLEDLQVCILTNHANPEYRRHCQSLGADYFLDKAMEFEKIMDIISP